MGATLRRGAGVTVGALLLTAVTTTPGGVTLGLPALGAAPSAGWYNPLKQARILDTRTGLGTTKAALGAGATRSVTVAGQGGIPVSGVAAVDLLVTASGGTAATALTVWTDGSTRPAAPVIRAPRAGTVTTTVTVPVSEAGKVAVHNQAGSVHVAASVLSWHKRQPGSTSTGLGLTPVDHGLVASTLTGAGVTKGAIPAGATRTATVAGRGGVPRTGVTAAELEVLVTAGTKPTRVTAYDASSTRPTDPSVVVPAGRTRATTMSLKLGTGSNAGKIKLYAAGGSAQVVVVNQGYHPAATTPSSLRLNPLPMAVLADTAQGVGVPKAKVGSGKSVAVQVTGRAGVPASAKAVVVSLGAAGATTKTRVTAYRDGATKPVTATLATEPGASVDSRVVLKPSATGKVRLHNSAGSTHLTMYVEGWYGVDPGPKALPDALPASVVEAAKVLTTGADPRQTGVGASALDYTRVAILNGEVMDASSGAPVAGAKVEVKDHPEYGSTLTTSQGTFDLAVNGGGTLTVDVTSSGRLPVQRTQEVPWLAWTAVEDVALTALAPPTTVTQGGDEVQVVQGETITDDAGERTATLLFEPGTSATMTKPDGSVVPLSDDMEVRATEFTAGAQGQEAMPGELPNNTGFTYASEFSVDQALEAGATEVSFSKPVNTYVDNFLDLKVGEDVPAGYYDREKGHWVPSKDGRVIGIVGETGGMADVDTDSDPAADPDTYGALSIDDAEREKLAGLYEPGDTLWRIPVDHFTPWDYNYPYGPPDGAGGPPGGPDFPGPGSNPDGGNSQDDETPCNGSGSQINCGSQSLGEVLPVAGTPLRLRYDSADVPGRAASRTIRVKLKGNPPMAIPQIAHVKVEVAGQTIEQNFQTYGSAPTFAEIQWDGKDSAGNVVLGRVSAHVTVGYGYKFVYREPATFAQSFAGFGGGVLFTREGAVASRPEVSLIQRSYDVVVENRDSRAQGFGGWTLDNLQTYDPEQRTLAMGDGRSRSGLDALSATMRTIAGDDESLGVVRGLASAPDGSVYVAQTGQGVVSRITEDGEVTIVAGGGFAEDGIGDGGPATEAELVSPWDVELLPDGSLLIADAGANRIRRVDADGTISTYAGGGTPEDGVGDGGQATDAALEGPRGIAATPAGAVYIADTGNARVRLVNADGLIQTAAGGGTPGDGVGDGQTGVLAKLVRPTDVAIRGTDTVIADPGAQRVRLLRLDGLITTVAGTGEVGAVEDGVPATESPLSSPTGVAADLLGRIYVADRLHNRIRRVEADGTIRTVAGTGSAMDWSTGGIGDGALPNSALLEHPESIDISGGGGLVIGDSGHGRVRAAEPALPGLDDVEGATFAVPSSDGQEAYVFDEAGRHIRTVDGLTGTRLFTFNYTNGLVSSVVDKHGLTTTINRSASGALTSIVAPTGQTTTFSLDSNGYLTQATDPAGKSWSYGYAAGASQLGLMTSHTDAAGGVHTFEYDGVGYLVKDIGPGGDQVTLARQRLDDGVRVTSTSGGGRVRVYESRTLLDGSFFRRTQDPDGTSTTARTFPDGRMVMVGPRGGRTEVVRRPSLIWGALVLVPASTTTTRRDGSVSTVTVDYELEREPDTGVVSRYARTISGDEGSAGDVWVRSTRTLTRTTRDGVKTSITMDIRDNVVSTKRGTLAATSYTRNARGQVLTETEGSGADARVTQHVYGSDGYLDSTTNPLGDTTTFVTDATGLVTSMTGPDGQTVSFTYDGLGRTTSLGPPGKVARTVAYQGDKLASWNPGSSPRTYQHADGLLTGQTGPVTSLTFTRDAQGRTTSMSGPEGYLVESTLTNGVVTSLTRAGGAKADYTFDANGLTTRTEWSGPVGGAVNESYDSRGRRTSSRVGDGAAVNEAWVREDLLQSVGGVTFGYDGDALLQSANGLGTSLAYTRNGFGEVVDRSAAAGGSEVFGQAITRDKAGRVTSLTERDAGTSTAYAFTYDKLGRLKAVTKGGAPWEAYAYDHNGNRTSATRSGTTTAATYNDADRLVSAGNVTYAHDGDGRRTGRTQGGQTTTYGWDAQGALTSVTMPSKDVSYVLDGMGLRVGRRVGGTVVEGYLYDSAHRLVATTDGSGAVTARFLYDQRHEAPVAMLKGGQSYRLVADHVGSVRRVVRASDGAVVQSIDYDAFGRVLSDSAPGFQPFGFAGGLTDRDTGLVHFGVRDYDPDAGRWLSLDPSGLDGGDANLYAYVGNDPVNRVDPTGLAGWPSLDLPDIDLPDIDFPDFDFPNPSDWGMCISNLAATTLDVLTYVPGIGTGVSIAVQAQKCLIGIECSKKDLAMTALGAIPGAKIAGKAGKWLGRNDSYNIGAAKEAMWASRGETVTSIAQGGLTGWQGAGSVHRTYTTYSGSDPLAYNGGGW